MRFSYWTRRATLVIATIALAGFALGTMPGDASAEQASQPASPAAGRIDVSAPKDLSGHTCALISGARCWGFGGAGRLGHGNEAAVGDDESPGSAGPVQVGAGRTATAIAVGGFHSCALLDDGSVRCWGFGGDGRLGYRNVATIGDDEPPSSAGPVDLGVGRTATAITAGNGHTCALLDDGSVRCWGFGGDGRLGYGNPNPIGDDETPGSVGPVDLGSGRTAVAISAGDTHTCAVLDDGTVRCWGFAATGQLGYANSVTIGNRPAIVPGTVGPVDLGAARTAKAISAGNGHTCALLDNGSVRCWGFGGNGRLGYGNLATIGDSETPGSAGPVDLGAGRTAVAISAGDAYTCAVLDDGTVRCWGAGADGRLGYANTNDIGDDETPGSIGPLNIGAGRTAAAISAGGRHTCALLDDAGVRCWGSGALGRLGYCNELAVGDDESPGSVGPVNVLGAVDCRPPAAPLPQAPGPRGGPAAPAGTQRSTAKLSLLRARVISGRRLLDVFAPITRLASGTAKVTFLAAGRSSRFSARVDAARGRIRFQRPISRAQARVGTGILTISYPGDADSRPQQVRLRAASRPARLRLARPLVRDGRLRASGTIAPQARGVVRLEIEYVHQGITKVARFQARIAAGRWRLTRALSPTTRKQLAARTGAVHSYTLFTGYQPRGLRGEMASYQVLPAG